MLTVLFLGLAFQKLYLVPQSCAQEDNCVADRTRHILLNLATNAVRYTLQGGIRFTLRREGGVVGVSVQDTGPGIAPEHLEPVFDRFFRIDQSRSRELGGTGLGLAIARLLAELQQGRITVESAVGDGSVFTLWLPASAT